MSEPTVTVGIDSDEWYPVYSIVSVDERYATRCEIPTSLVVRAELALKDFNEVQDEIERYLNAKEQS